MTTTGAERQFFGHPKGLGTLAGTQVWERFSYYGMQALLALYLVNYLLLPGNVEQVIGFAGFQRILETVFGPMTRLALASQIFGLYTGFAYLMPLAGAMVADRWLGQRKTTVLGLSLMAGGHLLMATTAGFLFALLLLVLGAGCIRGTMYAQVGKLYGAGDSRRTQGFSIYLIALNIGALLAPLVCGTLGERLGWHYGFGVAAIGMAIGLAIYLRGLGNLPPDQRRVAGEAIALSTADRRSIAAVLIILLPTTLIFIASQQAYNVLILWAASHVDRQIGGFVFPVTWLLTLDGIMTIFGVALTIPLFRWLAGRGAEPDTLVKIAIGGGLTALAYGLLALGTAASALVPALLVFGFFTLMDASFAWTDPVANSFVARFSPPALATTMMSINLTSFGVANIVTGWLGRFYEPWGAVRFWELHAGIAVAGAVLALVLRPLIAYLLAEHEEGPLALASTAY